MMDIPKINLKDKLDKSNKDVDDALDKETSGRGNVAQTIIDKMDVHAFSHITGGGILGNTMRVVPEGLSLNIDWDAWELPPIFKLIQKLGNVATKEMYKTFNMGVGFCVIAPETEEETLKKICKKHGKKLFRIGSIINEKKIILELPSEVIEYPADKY